MYCHYTFAVLLPDYDKYIHKKVNLALYFMFYAEASKINTPHLGIGSTLCGLTTSSLHLPLAAAHIS